MTSKVKMVWFLGALGLISLPGWSLPPVWVDFSGYDKSSGIEVSQRGSLVEVTWPGDGETLRMRFNLGDVDRLIRDVSVAKGSTFHPILENASPRYLCFSGKRRGGWDNFFDTPARYRTEVQAFDSSLAPDRCHVTSDHQRAQVAFNGLTVGIFRGQLVFTFYKGSSLIEEEAVVQTDEPDVAYYYDAWLTNCSTKNIKRLVWLNTEGEVIRHVLSSQTDLDQNRLQVHRRAIVAEGPNGSVGLFPPPHQFFFARDGTENLGYVWYRLYRILEQEELFSFGIRQSPEGGGSHSPLYNAPPGSRQCWRLFYFPTSGDGEETLRRISAYTHNDSFKPLPGYQAFTSHYHMGVAVASLAHQGKPYLPEFKPIFKKMGVKIVHVADFQGDGHPYSPTAKRLEELQALFNECRRLSDPDFLLLPGEEGNTYFGGHWNLLFPRPVYWFWVRSEGEPFEGQEAAFGHVYRVGSASDMFDLVFREKALAWQTHPRTKGSTGYPDRLIKQSYYQDQRWLGAAFKAMPSDLSSPRLGERALNVLDDMNNWGGRKFLVGEVDVFRIDHTHELYGHMNVNYLRMNRLPSFPSWEEVLEALRRGDFFVATGEVLIADFRVGGKRSGDTLVITPGTAVDISAELEWTFPLNLIELVWGDGKKVDRLVVPATETAQFGRKKFQLARDLTGLKWIRLAAWDVAGNGAYTQPVFIESTH